MLCFNLPASAGRLEGEDPTLRVNINRGTFVIFASLAGEGSLANVK